MDCVNYNKGMRVHLWIRKEDEAAWNAIKDRPEWLHEQLRDKSFIGLGDLVDDSVETSTYEGMRRITQAELTKQFDELNAEIAKDWALRNGWTPPEEYCE